MVDGRDRLGQGEVRLGEVRRKYIVIGVQLPARKGREVTVNM